MLRIAGETLLFACGTFLGAVGGTHISLAPDKRGKFVDRLDETVRALAKGHIAHAALVASLSAKAEAKPPFPPLPLKNTTAVVRVTLKDGPEGMDFDYVYGGAPRDLGDPIAREQIIAETYTDCGIEYLRYKMPVRIIVTGTSRQNPHCRAAMQMLQDLRLARIPPGA